MEAKPITYTIHIRNKPKYQIVLASLLEVLYPFDIKYSPDEVLKEYVTWAIEEVSQLEGVRINKDKKAKIIRSINRLESALLRKAICEMVLSGEKLSIIRDSTFDWMEETSFIRGNKLC